MIQPYDPRPPFFSCFSLPVPVISQWVTDKQRADFQCLHCCLFTWKSGLGRLICSQMSKHWIPLSLSSSFSLPAIASCETYPWTVISLMHSCNISMPKIIIAIPSTRIRSQELSTPWCTTLMHIELFVIFTRPNAARSKSLLHDQCNSGHTLSSQSTFNHTQSQF